MIGVERVDYIRVPVTDMDAANHFYGELLGLEPNPNSPGDDWVEYEAGNVTLASAVRIDVSGAGSHGAGGSLSLSAPVGEVQLGGTLLGRAGESAAGASLSVDAGRALDVGRVAAKTGDGQFSGAIALRQREGELAIGPAATLAAREIALQALVMIVFTILITYPVMGRNYDAAVIAGGQVGFGLSSTACALAIMKAVTGRHGASALAFLIVPMVGAFFIDILIAMVIQGSLALPLFGFGR